MSRRDKKIAICGHFGAGNNFKDGQTVKTKTLTESLQEKLVETVIWKIDTYKWKKKPIRLIVNMFIASWRCKRILVLPAQGGVKVIIPIFIIMKYFMKTNIYYVVIGGWLNEYIEKNNWLIKYLKKCQKIYVETQLMQTQLIAKGIRNVEVLPNCKNLNILNEVEYVNSTEKPLRLCTFSRVMKEKGIEDIIKDVEVVNKRLGYIAYELDIYGPVNKVYQEQFDQVLRESSSQIAYKGEVNYQESIEIIRQYFMLAFPTRFKTEGIPGTIIDAYAAGVPVIASEWLCAREIIQENRTGKIFPIGDVDSLIELLIQIEKDPNRIIEMKKNCLGEGRKYTTEVVMTKLISSLEIE